MAFFKQCVAAALLAAVAPTEAAEVSLRPNVHGVLRPRYELSVNSGESRFQVRNARLTLDGKIAAPAEWFMQVDLCDRGSIKPLDFWARLALGGGLKLQAGQFRMPFGVDPFRAPANYVFANRSFIGKQICNYRAVGFKLSYTLPCALPVVAEGGVFNPYTIGNHDVWSKDMAYAAKATLGLHGVRIAGGFMSICPDGVRANLSDVCLGWGDTRWNIEAEYMYEHYTNRTHKPCHGFNVFADYRFPVRLAIFNRMSVQARFDAMTAHSNCRKDDTGTLSTDDGGRRRLTLGWTVSHIHSPSVYADLRLNFEKYFYDGAVEQEVRETDRLLLEMVFRF